MSRLLVIATLILAGCGGNGGSDAVTPPASSVPAGRLDTTFGNNGSIVGAGSMALGLDDRAYAAMRTGIARLDERGTQTDLFGEGSFGHLLVDEQGSVYAFATSPSLGIAKFHPDGPPFVEFGVNGHAALGSRTDSIFDVRDLARDPEGSLYLVGTRSFSFTSARYGAIAKFDPGGRLVTTFGNDGGILNFDMPGGRLSTAHAARADALGHLYVSGWAVHWDSQDFTIYVAKLDREGAFERAFGSDGVWFSPHCFSAPNGNPPEFVLGQMSATTLTLGAPGEVLVGGRCQPPGSPGRPLLARLDARGIVVESFREGGLRFGLFGPEIGDSYSNVTGLLMAPGGTIYATGSKQDESLPCGDFAVASLTAAGEPITTFGSDGVATLDGARDYHLEPALDSRGLLYLVGASSVPCPTGRLPGYLPSLHRMGG